MEIDSEGVDWSAIVDETTADEINKEEKAKPKALASCADGNEKFPCLRTTLSPTVDNNKIKTKQ